MHGNFENIKFPKSIFIISSLFSHNYFMEYKNNKFTLPPNQLLYYWVDLEVHSLIRFDFYYIGYLVNLENEYLFQLQLLDRYFHLSWSQLQQTVQKPNENLLEGKKKRKWGLCNSLQKLLRSGRNTCWPKYSVVFKWKLSDPFRCLKIGTVPFGHCSFFS